MQAMLDEITEKSLSLTHEERRRLIAILQEQENKTQEKTGAGYVSPDTIWIKEHHHEYAGNYVALKNGELIAYGKTIKEADLKAKEKGVKNSLLTYLPKLDEEIFCGGWM